MADIRQIIFRQIFHRHHGIAVVTVLQHGTVNFNDRFALNLFDASQLAMRVTSLSPFFTDFM
ncbi:hypothetical protein ACYBZ5_25245 [Klebsiella pneumoniae]|uniref:hypothetical protein n=1 Tax=Klebsiella pneumoniae TaxID=573 RepID=UPI000CFA8B0D|nr:hypothetical protein [Klebsiella pneumoniae]MDF6112538.1 hypothetical protein [Escherichia coli]AZJ02125.1 hypothetical protein C5X33_27975 [Klebsiella pneumoniae subsp. pneumoniae]EKX2644747.1 hypothetical protein [Klebsiella pneumoniae]MDF6513281.1 hypothetical protein [Escherichia coli]MDF6566286.1 hypothetical protein [Escherichia coli]